MSTEKQAFSRQLKEYGTQFIKRNQVTFFFQGKTTKLEFCKEVRAKFRSLVVGNSADKSECAQAKGVNMQDGEMNSKADYPLKCCLLAPIEHFFKSSNYKCAPS